MGIEATRVEEVRVRVLPAGRMRRADALRRPGADRTATYG